MLFIVPDLELTAVMISDPSPHPRAESHVPALYALLEQGVSRPPETAPERSPDRCGGIGVRPLPRRRLDASERPHLAVRRRSAFGQRSAKSTFTPAALI